MSEIARVAAGEIRPRGLLLNSQFSDSTLASKPKSQKQIAKSLSKRSTFDLLMHSVESLNQN